MAARYAGWLASVGIERGLIGPRERPRLWDRHLLNCVAIAPLLSPGARIIDLGSGAGLPGIVLAVARPDAEVYLVDAQARRVAFLTEVIDDLGLDQVRVVRGRAGPAGIREVHGAGFVGLPLGDVVTARAVAPLSQLIGWSLPLLAPGGRLLAVRGERAEVELGAAVAQLRRLSVTDWQVIRCGEAGGRPRAVVVAVRAVKPSGRRGRRGGRLAG